MYVFNAYLINCTNINQRKLIWREDTHHKAEMPVSYLNLHVFVINMSSW